MRPMQGGQEMNIFRMLIGIALFLASSWISPYLADVLGIPGEIGFLCIGGILSFLGGMLFYSGVRMCRYSYRF